MLSVGPAAKTGPRGVRTGVPKSWGGYSVVAWNWDLCQLAGLQTTHYLRRKAACRPRLATRGLCVLPTLTPKPQPLDQPVLLMRLHRVQHRFDRPRLCSSLPTSNRKGFGQTVECGAGHYLHICHLQMRLHRIHHGFYPLTLQGLRKELAHALRNLHAHTRGRKG